MLYFCYFLNVVILSTANEISATVYTFTNDIITLYLLPFSNVSGCRIVVSLPYYRVQLQWNKSYGFT